MSDSDRRTAVAVVQGDDRRENVAAALGHVAGQIELDGVHNVLIKPNFVAIDKPLAATHVDAVRATLDVVRARYAGPILVAEGAAMAPTGEGFRNYGYQPLVDEYGVELVDLNADRTVPVLIYTRHMRVRTVYLSRTVVEAGYRISVALPKAHDRVIVTLAVKNMVMGSLVNPTAVRTSGGAPGLMRSLAHLLPKQVRQSNLAEWVKGSLLGPPRGSSKMAMHQGFPVINLNLALVAPYVWPHLAVIDGWQGMEGQGPSAGTPVDWQVAMAGTDPLAVDVLTAHLMGFDPQQVGYLQYCRRLGLGVGDVDQIDVVGNVDLPDVQRSFTPHPTYQRQLAWQLKGIDRYLLPGQPGA